MIPWLPFLWPISIVTNHFYRETVLEKPELTTPWTGSRC